MKAQFKHAGKSIDYRPGSPVAAGSVVVIGGQLVTIAHLDIAADALGALSTEGVYVVEKDGSNISDGDPAYWDDNGNPVDGTALSGAFSSDPSLGPFAGYFIGDAGVGATHALLYLRSMTDMPVEGSVSGNLTVAGTTTVTSTSASALAVGRQGATAPALKINANTANQASGVEVIGKASGDGVDIKAIGGTNEALGVDAKGTGTLTLQPTATGEIVAKTKVQATDAGIRTKMSTDNVHDTAPTEAELIAAFGTAAAAGSGFIGVVKDADGDTNAYLVFSTGAKWCFLKFTVAS